VTAGANRTPAAVEVDGLTKNYGGRAVVRDLSFRIGAGETFALLGPNGAGKTTTVEIVEGYRRPDRGSVRVLGEDPARSGRDHRARVGLMLQGGGGVDPRMTAREVIRLHGGFHAAPRDADELLELVGLTAVARSRYRRLSGGERQRLGLALALVGKPRLIALDEPTAGMDVEARASTRGLIGRLRHEGVTVLLTSHDLGDVEKVADRIAIIDRGRLVAIGTPTELTQGSLPVLRFRLDAILTEPDRRGLENRIGEGRGATILEDEGGGRYRLTGAPSPELVALVADWCASRGALIVELRTAGGSLEERYLELVGGASDAGE
jgi:ABC-2 type transport system ATP-binding protein